MNKRKWFNKVTSGSANVRFEDLVTPVKACAFQLSRVKGSHHGFSHPGIHELLNLQEVKGKVKPYQIRQFLALVDQYNMDLGD